MKYYINVNHKDYIDRLVFQENNLHKFTTETQYVTDEYDVLETSTDEIASLLNSDYKCGFSGDGDGVVVLSITRPMTVVELSEKLEGVKNNIAYHYSKLRKWCDNSVKSYNEIHSYIKRHNITLNEYSKLQ